MEICDTCKEYDILEIGAGNTPKTFGKKVTYLDRINLIDLYGLEPFILGCKEAIQHDLEDLPLPFRADSFNEIYASHILEHIQELCPLMDELWRIMKVGGILKIWVPYYKHKGAFKDPTHVRYFTDSTFGYFQYSPTYNVVEHFWKVIKVEKGSMSNFNPKTAGRIIKNIRLRKWVYAIIKPFFRFPTKQLYAELQKVE